MSTLVFDGVTHTLTLLGAKGQSVGQWHANNVVDHRATMRFIPNRSYQLIDKNRAHTHGGMVDSINGAYGRYGIIRLEPFQADGHPHSGVGVHAGRADKGGADHATMGCIRTTDAAMEAIVKYIRTDPAQTIKVQHNHAQHNKHKQHPADHHEPGKPTGSGGGAATKINTAGETLIKNAEAKGGIPDLKAYICPAGKWTIGWGHTGADVKPGMTIDKGQAEALFRRDVSKFETVVGQVVKVPLTVNQFSALVSFAYNVGPENFKTSTLLKKLNEKDYQGAAGQFQRWVHGGGKVLPGLVTRRKDEEKLFQAA